MYHGVAEDLKCFWERAAVGIAPLWLASGRQFKVIEYLAAGVPTVTTPVVARNLGVQSGRELLALEDDASFASAVIRLCREPEFGAGIGAAGRNFARAHFSLTRVRQAVADLCREAWA
jgi:glycosyltransferase involved in cell wall biosynthesis